VQSLLRHYASLCIIPHRTTAGGSSLARSRAGAERCSGRSARPGRASARPGDSQSLPPPDPFDPPVVHTPALHTQHRRGFLGAVPPVLRRQLDDLPRQRVFVVTHCQRESPRRGALAQRPTRLRLRHTQMIAHVLDHPASMRWAQEPPDAASHRIKVSSSASVSTDALAGRSPSTDHSADSPGPVRSPPYSRHRDRPAAAGLNLRVTQLPDALLSRLTLPRHAQVLLGPAHGLTLEPGRICGGQSSGAAPMCNVGTSVRRRELRVAVSALHPKMEELYRYIEGLLHQGAMALA
jgi:hypothetical protein